MVKNLPANARDVGDVIRSLGQVICPRGGNGKALQFSCLENLLDRVACLAPVHTVTKSQIQLSHFHFLSFFSPVNVGLRVLFFSSSLEIRTGRAEAEKVKVLL